MVGIRGDLVLSARCDRETVVPREGFEGFLRECESGVF
jgi:hypothetical protein